MKAAQAANDASRSESVTGWSRIGEGEDYHCRRMPSFLVLVLILGGYPFRYAQLRLAEVVHSVKIAMRSRLG